MRTRNPHPTTRRLTPAKVVTFGAGVLLATAGLASAATAAPKDAVEPRDVGGLVLVTTTTRATTTTSRRPPVTFDVCRIKPELCPPPPTRPCVPQPQPEPEPPLVLRREGEADLTARTLTTRPRPTTTRPKPQHCPPPPTKPEPRRPDPVRVTPTFTG
jgi:hypothetical protein